MEKDIIIEEIDEEIDLGKYLKIIWKNKFLILTIIMVSLISASYYSFFVLQNEYQADALLYIYNLPEKMNNSERYTSPRAISSTITSNDMITKTVVRYGVAEIEPFKNLKTPKEGAINWFKENIKVETWENCNNQNIKVTLKGLLQPEIMHKTLQMHLQIVMEENKKNLTQDAEREVKRIDLLIASLMNQRNETLLALDNVLEDNSSNKIVMLERIIGYQSRLITIEDRLNSLRTSRMNMEIMTSPDYNWIEIVSSPYISVTPIGPERKLNIAIAGIIGLLIGILAAFYKNHMEDSH